ncbi:chitobiase/beta-hexosaminidase C-terminal domain-containing protein [Desulfobacterales bacterium HSG17]|nr:chitobiase/beta-hexosaminidase C-terminal domain-containing protein [Desulfobacterales bacterium HSG17]
MKTKTKSSTLSIILFLTITLTAFAWPIPDTGQKKCYNDTQEIPCPQPGEPFYGQDGNYLINSPSYTKLDASGNDLADDATSWFMVRDNVTGLIWEVKQNKDDVPDYSNPHDADNTYTWYDSNPETNGGDAGQPGDGTDTVDFINALNAENFGGFPDWRMPTREDLRSIAYYVRYDPVIDTKYFPNTLSDYYWSSSTYVSWTINAWYVHFDSGGDSYGSKRSNRYVRAVRGGQSHSFDHLLNNSDGTITDTATGLMWQQAGSDINMTWENALAYCENLSTSGHDDWRLPDLKELASIVDLTQHSPAINTEYFSNTEVLIYWLSSTHVRYTDHARCMNFDNGYGSYGSKTSSRYVRAVRGGQSRLFDHLIISSPDQASRWNIGDQKIITWDTQNIQGNVQISLSRQGGKQGTFETISESTENDGAYTWTVNSPESFNCAINIEPISEINKGNSQSLFSICTLKDVWIEVKRMNLNKFRLTLNGLYTDGVVPIKTTWSSSNSSIALIQYDDLIGLVNGWVDILTTFMGKTYSKKGLPIYITFEAMEIEPNNTSSQPFPITENKFYEANIPVDTDTDYFKITLQSASIIDIGFLSKSTTADINIEILNSSETLMASATSQNANPLIFPLGLSAGTYYVKATSAGDIDQDKPYIITYKIQDTLSAKTDIPLDMPDTAQSSINHLQNESLFPFTLSKFQAIKIDLTPSGDQAKYRMELVNSTGTVIDTVVCLEYAPVSLEGAFPADSYTIRVIPVEDIDAKAQFSISLNPSTKQLETEPNNSAETSTDFNITSPISARLSDASDTDFFTFNLDSPKYLQFNFSCPESAKNFALGIFKDSGENQIDGIETQNGTDVTLHMGLNVGKYYIRVTPLGDAETIASYTLTIQDSDQTDLEIESNNTLKFANSIENNASRRGRIYSASDADHFGFYLPDTTAFDINFTPTTTTGDYTIKVINDNDVIITQQTSTDGEAKSFPGNAYSGNYYIKVEPGTDIDQYNPYQLNITSTGTLTGLKQIVSINVSGTNQSMTIGQTQTVSASTAYSDATSTPIPSPTWTSLDDTIATVNASGLITAAGTGTTSIIATFGDLTGKFDITVGVPPNYYAQHHGNLILVAGGGNDSTDPLFESTQYLSDLVYRRFQDRFFQDSDIHYFNPTTFHDLDGDGLDNGVVDDTTPTVNEFGQSITDWAALQSTDGPLYIYMIDHGGVDTFNIFPGEILNASQFSGFLNTFQNATGRQIVVMIEACKSGTFVDDLTADNRVIITSTNDKNAYVELGGSASFTQFFIDRLLAGDSILKGWESSKTQLSAMGIPYSTMQPQLAGTALAPEIIMGGKFAIAPNQPEIIGRTANASIQANSTQTLYADVSDDNGIESVLAVIITPDYTAPAISQDLKAIETGQPVIVLTDPDKDGRYETTYNNFTSNGEYKFIFYATSKINTLNISPATILTVSGGEPLNTVETPSLSPVPGTYTTAQTITITCTTADAEIRYSTDNSEPTEISTLYSAPISISTTTTLKTKAFKTNWTSSETASGLYTITGKVAAPAFSPAPGIYTTAQNVTITCSTSGAAIHYTTDGSEPTAASAAYTAPIPVSAATAIKTKAFKTDWDNSDTTTGEYTITGKVAAPAFSPAPDVYTTTQNVTLTCTTSGAAIRYTTNGSDPTESSQEYTAPIPVTSSMTIKAKAFKTDWESSDTAEGIYSITGTIAAPTFSPDPGTYTTEQNVTLSCNTPEVSIHYTTDGNEPTETSLKYTSPIKITSDTTIKAKAFKTDWTPSQNSTGIYKINPVQKGDLNGDNNVDLTDAVIGLKVTAGADTTDQIRESYSDSGADVNENGIIGLEEVIYILQKTAGM